jgi:hypothetical protein
MDNSQVSFLKLYLLGSSYSLIFLVVDTYGYGNWSLSWLSNEVLMVMYSLRKRIVANEPMATRDFML